MVDLANGNKSGDDMVTGVCLLSHGTSPSQRVSELTKNVDYALISMDNWFI